MWNLFQYRSYITLKKGSHFLPKYEEIPTESFSISWTWNEALSAFKITHIFVTEFSLFSRIIPPNKDALISSYTVTVKLGTFIDNK
jgi:hypothetical protein